MPRPRWKPTHLKGRPLSRSVIEDRDDLAWCVGVLLRYERSCEATCPRFNIDQTMATVTKILVPVDFSETSKRALDFARMLADRYGASLQLLHVIGFRLLIVKNVERSPEETRSNRVAAATHYP